MREIKFRAWDKENKEWCEWDDGDIVIHNDGTFEPHERLVLMQFTGLHDKNGKEIYEGDILSWGAGDKSVVKWEFGGFLAGGRFQEISYEKSKIIGNIYENPELLDDSKKES
jgi:hypothetical protein